MPLYNFQSCLPMLLKQLVKPPTAQKSLERMLGLENVDWSRIYLLPRATTIESSLRSFQYKILNNTLYLNERQFKLKAVESPQCSLCKQFKGSVLHLFCTCSVTRNLWAKFCVWASNANISLTSEELQDQAIVNHLILLFKRYIYLKRGDKTAPNTMVGFHGKTSARTRASEPLLGFRLKETKNAVLCCFTK